MLSEQEKRDLQQGTFEIDCPAMILRRQASTDERVFSGPGFIKQTSDRSLYFKLYPGDEFDALVSELEEFFSGKLGELIPESEFFSLFATDLHGQRWTSSRVSPPGIEHGEGTVVTGYLDEIVSSADRVSESPRRAYLALRVFDDVKIPLNTVTETTTSVGGKKLKSRRLNAWNFVSCGNTFHLTQESGLLKIEVTSDDDSFPDHLEKRVIEALQFVLARPLWWTVMQKWSDGVEEVRIRRQHAVVSNPRLQPPIKFHEYGGDVTHHVRKLFDNYLQYIISHPRDKWHPLSARLHSVCEASGGSLDAEGLTLGVSVEGVLRSEFSELGRPSEDTKKALQQFGKYLKAWDGDETVKRRIQGTVGAMYRPRAKDRMLALIECGAMTDEQLKAWEDLRHSSAHAERPDSKPLQEFIQLCRMVTVLLYHLVFQAIGYEGMYTDYSADGWPLKEYSGSRTDNAKPASQSGDRTDLEHQTRSSVLLSGLYAVVRRILDLLPVGRKSG